MHIKDILPLFAFSVLNFKKSSFLERIHFEKEKNKNN
jgi:hypothetical protein